MSDVGVYFIHWDFLIWSITRWVGVNLAKFVEMIDIFIYLWADGFKLLEPME